MNGCPALWAENDLGTYLMKNYLSQKKWRDDTYEDIANFCVSSWAEQGLRTVEEIEKGDARPAPRRKNPSRSREETPAQGDDAKRLAQKLGIKE